MLSVKQGSFCEFSVLRPGIESRFPWPLANLLRTMPWSRLDIVKKTRKIWFYIYTCIQNQDFLFFLHCNLYIYIYIHTYIYIYIYIYTKGYSKEKWENIGLEVRKLVLYINYNHFGFFMRYTQTEISSKRESANGNLRIMSPIFVMVFNFIFPYAYLSSPHLPFDHHRNCHLSLLLPCLSILLPCYIFVTLRFLSCWKTPLT